MDTTTKDTTNLITSNKSQIGPNVESPISNEELAAFYLSDKMDERDFYKNAAVAVREMVESLIKEFAGVIETTNKAAQLRYTGLLAELSNQNAQLSAQNKLLLANQEIAANALRDISKTMVTINNTIAASSNSVVDLSGAISSVKSELCEVIKNVAGSRETTTDINASARNLRESNTVFTFSKTAAVKNIWIDKVRGEIANICIEKNIGKPIVYKCVWDQMRKRNYNIDELLINYRKISGDSTSDKFTMVSNSDELMDVFENCVRDLKRILPVKPKSSGNYYRAAHSCPREITEIVSKLSKTGNPTGRTFNKAYSLIGIDLDELVATTSKRLGIPGCSIPYAISQNPDVMRSLVSAVNEYVKKSWR